MIVIDIKTKYTYAAFIKKMFGVKSTVLPNFIRKETSTIQRRLKVILRTGSRTGTHYKGLPNRSSDIGEAPRSQSGTLANSIQKAVRVNSAGTTGSVFTDLLYAKYLEQGTRKMQPRPLFKPVAEERLPIIKENIKKDLKRHFENVH